jgi:chromosome segregation ATPase
VDEILREIFKNPSLLLNGGISILLAIYIFKAKKEYEKKAKDKQAEMNTLIEKNKQQLLEGIKYQSEQHREELRNINEDARIKEIQIIDYVKRIDGALGRIDARYETLSVVIDGITSRLAEIKVVQDKMAMSIEDIKDEVNEHSKKLEIHDIQIRELKERLNEQN